MADPQPPPMPPVPYCVIYRLGLPVPPGPVKLWSQDGLDVEVGPGGFRFGYSESVPAGEPPARFFTSARREMSVPAGATMVVTKWVNLDRERDGVNGAALEVGTVAALFELASTGMLLDKFYEGVVDRPGSFTHIGPSPVRIVSRAPPSPDFVVRNVQSGIASYLAMVPAERQRFTLAARWYARAGHADNHVDKILFYWTVLEVFPSTGSSAVAKLTTEFLAKNVLDDSWDADTLKKRLLFNKITRFRARIVHDGLAFVPPQDARRVGRYVDTLQTVALTCLRVFGGQDPGNDLADFLRSDG